MAEYIERETALKIIDNYAKTVTNDGLVVVNAIKDIISVICPAADVEPVKHGKWTSNGDDWECYKCSICRNEAYWDADYGQQLFDFCPWCGSKMDGKEVQE